MRTPALLTLAALVASLAVAVPAWAARGVVSATIVVPVVVASVPASGPAAVSVCVSRVQGDGYELVTIAFE